MRKLISMSVLVLLLSVIATTAMASGVEDCDLELKHNSDAPKGLYGLCIAFWNTEGSNGQDRIRALYAKKAEAAGFSTDIPGDDEGFSGPCLCWPDQDTIKDAVCNYDLTYTEVGSADVAQFDGGTIVFLADGSSNSSGCLYTKFEVPIDFIDLSTTEEENLACRSSIMNIIELAMKTNEVLDAYCAP